jgi:phage-related minor tail protein
VANKENTPSMADRLRALRDQAEKLTQELDKLEKEAGQNKK